MTSRRVRISVSDLPLRARSLGPTDLANVFGGGIPLHSYSGTDGKCCSTATQTVLCKNGYCTEAIQHVKY